MRRPPPTRGRHREVVGLALALLLARAAEGQCEPLAASIRQVWNDLEIFVPFPSAWETAGVVEDRRAWFLLRTGSRFDHATSVPGAELNATHWPFDRALRFNVGRANLTSGACEACVAHVIAPVDGWWRRAVATSGRRDSDPGGATVLLDDNVLGLHVAPTVAWCLAVEACPGECLSSGAFAFESAWRWASGVVRIAGSHRHFCAVLESGAVQCWGSNAHGQLGQPHVRPVRWDPASWHAQPPVDVGPDRLRFEAVAVGFAHSCGQTTDGAVYCWGSHSHGQLGLGDSWVHAEDEAPGPASRVLLPSAALSLAAGGNHTCVVLADDDGSLWCWGANEHGQLGLGDTIRRDRPAAVGLGVRARVVSAGAAHTCVLATRSSDGFDVVLCGGANDAGQLGLGHTLIVGDDEPLSLASVAWTADSGSNAGVTNLHCGRAHSCVVLHDGTTLCWGENTHGQLGLGHTASPTTVSAVDAVANAVVFLNATETHARTPALAVRAGGHHTCALSATHWLHCWGLNSDGQLGTPSLDASLGDEPTDLLFPVDTGGEGADLALGVASTCLVRPWGSVACWGTDPGYEVEAEDQVTATSAPGNTSSSSSSSSPLASRLRSPLVGAWVEPAVSRGSAVFHGLKLNYRSHLRSIGLGPEHTCVVLAGGELQCWGRNQGGQLGYGSLELIGDNELPSSMPPVSVGGSVEVVVMGYTHTCALLSTRDVRCWGEGSEGQLGLGTWDTIGDNELPSSAPTVDVGGPVDELMSGRDYVCVILVGGAVRCWGSNDFGELGLGHTHTIGDNELPSSQPVVSLGRPARSFASGGTHGCAILEGAVLRCWGVNDNGQLGLGHTNSVGDDELPSSMAFASVGGPVVDVGAGFRHTCVLLAEGTLRCFGENLWGQLGQGHTRTIGDDEAPSAEPVVPLDDLVTQVSCRGDQVCAVLVNGNVRCWGWNARGELGLGHTRHIGDNEAITSSPPAKITAWPVQVAMGEFTTCVVSVGAFVTCWGVNDKGQLGLGHTENIGNGDRPVRSSAIGGARAWPAGNTTVAVATGYGHTCAVSELGVVRCWGRNQAGQLGNGNLVQIGDDELPSSVGAMSLGGDAPVVSLSAGELHTCALLADGQVRCWGTNGSGRLGLGHSLAIGDDELPSASTSVSLGGPASAVECGNSHSCALMTNGAVRCWGLGSSGRLGLSNTISIGDNELPSSVANVSIGGDATAVTGGGSHTCAILSSGLVRCWGLGSSGQLGLSSTTTIGDNEHPRVTATVSLNGLAAGISAGFFHTCVVMTTGAVRCWGMGSDGQLGLGHMNRIGDNEHPSSEPLVLGDGMAVSVDCGDEHTCVVLTTGRVRCWGGNSEGWLGLNHMNDIGDDELPVDDVELDAPALSVSGGETHTCAVLANGVVQCWGANNYGQLGLGHTARVGNVRIEDDTVVLDDLRQRMLRNSSANERVDESCRLGSTACGVTTGTRLARTHVLRAHVGDASVVRTLPGHADHGLSPTHWDSSAAPLRASPRGSAFHPLEHTWWADVSVHPISRDEALCASKTFETQNATWMCVVEAPDAWLETTPDSALVAASSPTLLWPRGGSIVFLTFSTPWVSVDVVPTLSIGGFNCTDLQFLNATTIQCQLAPGRGTDLLLDLFLASEALPTYHTVVERFAFEPPVVRSVFPALNMAPFGNLSIRVEGYDFGVPHESDVLTLGAVPCDVVSWTDTLVRCRSRPTTLSDSELSISLGGQTSTYPVSFAQPQIVFVKPSIALPANDSSTMHFNLSGTSFGVEVGGSLTVHIGGMRCGAAHVRSPALIECLDLPIPLEWPSTSASVSFGIIAAEQPSVLRTLPPPRLDGIIAAEYPTRGGTRVRLRGEGLGLTASDLTSVRVGATELAPENLTWTSESEVSFRLPRGVGANQPLRVHIARGMWSNALSFSYDAPVVTDIAPDYALAGPAPHAFVITGTNFGFESAHITEVRVGGVACPVVRALNDTALECAGLVANRDPADASTRSAWPDPDIVEVTIGGQRSDRARGLVRTFDLPVVLEVQPFEVTPGDELTISGTNFGLSPADVVGVRIGNDPCTSFSWQSQERLKCALGPTHPLFDPSNRPANSSTAANWLKIDVEMRTGALSVESSDWLDDSSIITTPRAAPLFWIDAKVPRAVVTDVKGVREVGRFEAVAASWTVRDVASLDESSQALRVTGFLLEGTASDRRTYRTFVPLSIARFNISDPGSFRGELTVSSRLPITLTITAQNAYGFGSASLPSSPIYETCEKDQFLATHRDPALWKCESCPLEAICGGLRAENVTARPGFWRVPWSEGALGFTACRFELACLGWDGSIATLAEESRLSLNRTATGDSTLLTEAVPGLALDPAVEEKCNEGYEGVKCASCSHSWFKDTAGNCIQCGSWTLIILRLVGLVLLFMLLISVLLVRAFNSAGESSSGVIRIMKSLLNHFQTIAIISTIRFQWPPIIASSFTVSNSASSFGIEGVSIECALDEIGRTPLGQSLLALSAPFWLLLYAALFWAAGVARDWTPVLEALMRAWAAVSGCLRAASRSVRGACSCRTRASGPQTAYGPGGSASPTPAGHLQVPNALAPLPPSTPILRRMGTVATLGSSATDPRLQRWIRRMKVSIPVLVFLVHTSVTKAAFQMVTCEDVAPDSDPTQSEFRLSMDLNTRCDEPSNLSWMLGFSLPVLLIFSLGIPIATSAFIRVNLPNLQAPETRRLFGFLFAGYRGGYEWWEGVTMLRKVLLAGVTVVLGPSGAFNQVGAALFVVVSFGFLHAWIQPHVFPRFNVLEMLSLSAATLTMLAGLFIEGSSSVVVVQYVCPLVILVGNAVFVLMIGKEIVATMRGVHAAADRASNELSLAGSAPSLGPGTGLVAGAKGKIFPLGPSLHSGQLPGPSHHVPTNAAIAVGPVGGRSVGPELSSPVSGGGPVSASAPLLRGVLTVDASPMGVSQGIKTPATTPAPSREDDPRSDGRGGGGSDAFG